MAETAGEQRCRPKRKAIRIAGAKWPNGGKAILRQSLLGAIALILSLCADANKLALAQNGASPGCTAETPQKTVVRCLRLIAASENQVEIADALLVLCKLVGHEYSEDGQIARFCDRAVTLNPNLPAALEARSTSKLRAYSFVSDAKEKERLLSEAKQDCDQLVTLAPNDARTWIAQANLAIRQADWLLALSSVDKAAAIAPNDASICSLRGGIHGAMHQQDDALADYLHCVRLAPGDARALANIAQIYFKKQEYSKALDYASKVIGAGGHDETLDAYVLLGTIHLQMGDAGQAKNDFKQALAIRYWDKRALVGLEKATGSRLPLSRECVTGNLSEETVKICSAVLEYVTDYTAVEHRAHSYLALKKFDLAAADYTTLIVNEPGWPGYYFSRALAYEASGKLAEALADVGSSIAEERKKEEETNELELSQETKSKILEKLGFKAIDDRPVNSKPQLPRLFLNYELRAEILSKLGRQQEAIEAYSRILSMDPKQGKARLGRGEIYNHLGQTDAAIADVDKVLALYPNFPGAHALKGALLAKLGQRERATEELRRAVVGGRNCESRLPWCINPTTELERLGVPF